MRKRMLESMYIGHKACTWNVDLQDPLSAKSTELLGYWTLSNVLLLL